MIAVPQETLPLAYAISEAAAGLVILQEDPEACVREGAQGSFVVSYSHMANILANWERTQRRVGSRSDLLRREVFQGKPGEPIEEQFKTALVLAKHQKLNGLRVSDEELRLLFIEQGERVKLSLGDKMRKPEAQNRVVEAACVLGFSGNILEFDFSKVPDYAVKIANITAFQDKLIQRATPTPAGMRR